MTAHARAWESAVALIQDYPDRLTAVQQIACRIALMAGPDGADLGVIAIAACVIGERR